MLIEGNEIREVSARPIAASNAERVDCRGKTVMPGMIDNHVHVYIDSLKVSPPEPPQGLEIMKRAGLKMGFGTDLLGAQHTRCGTEFTLRSRVLEPFDILHSATAVQR